ncbi:hypothetical protein GCM10009665_42040 [Kitasatospora nipponensis]|uniref:DUF2254 domain-containing protein n=1 Tax=Kitasatospora nipponensis TaxID=258049 RepID=A0ABN1WFK1_9ACTN
MARPVLLRRRPGLRGSRSQLLFTLVGVALGLAVPTITAGPQVPGRQVSDMLLALGFGVLGTSVVIFSLLFLVVQWAHTSFTPRLTLFREAPVVWRTFAFAIGLAVYCVTAALAIAGRQRVTAFVPIVAGLLALVLLALLRILQLRAFAAIQLAPVLHAITERGSAILEALNAQRAASTATAPTAAPLPVRRSTVRWPESLAVLQQVDTDRLLAAAQAAGAVVVLHTVPGATLSRGAAVADVHGADLPAGAVLGSLVTGAERTFDQDPLLAFRLIADIVLRSLSAAVNDPASAVQGLDCLEDLLGGPAAEQTGTPLTLADRAGVPRLVVEVPDWEEYLRTGLDDVIAAAVRIPMVLLRLRELLERLLLRSPAHRRDLLGRRLAWVERALAEGFPLLWQEAGPGAGPG